MSHLITFLQQILTWLESFFQWAFAWLWQEIIGGLTTLLSAIPVPQWLTDAPSVLANIPSGILWILGILQFPSGMSILIGSWLLRFLIRRMPIIG